MGVSRNETMKSAAMSRIGMGEPLVESFAVEDEEDAPSTMPNRCRLQNGEQHRDADDHTHAQQIAGG